MYGATTPTPPTPPAARRTSRAAYAGVAAALLLLAGATLSRRSALDTSASLAAELKHDDEYQPLGRLNYTDDDGLANATTTGGEAKTVEAETAKGDMVDHSWADATVEIDVRKYKYVAQYLEERGVDSDAPAEVMRDYVPKLKLRYNKKRSEGTIGPQASTGCALSRSRAQALGDEAEPPRPHPFSPSGTCSCRSAARASRIT